MSELEAPVATAEAASASESYISGFIDSAYLGEFTIPANPPFHSAVFIRYRPVTAEDESIVRAKSRIDESIPWLRHYAEMMVGDAKRRQPAKLLGWDLKDRDGKTVEISVDNICSLCEPLFDQIYSAMKLRAEDPKNS